MYFNCCDYVFLLYVYVWLLWLRFFRAFSSVVREMPGQNPQRRGTVRTLPNFCVVVYIVCFVLFPALFVCKCVLYYCHRVATQLQLTNISYHLSTSTVCLLTIHNYTSRNDNSLYVTQFKIAGIFQILTATYRWFQYSVKWQNT